MKKQAGVDPCVPVLNPETFFVDVIPTLKYIPGWQRSGDILLWPCENIPYEHAKRGIVWFFCFLIHGVINKFCVEKGAARSSFCMSSLLKADDQLNAE